MRIDLTVKVEQNQWRNIFNSEKMTSLGHLGTHFDVMDKPFSLDNTRRWGRILDVHAIRGRDIGLEDIDLNRLGKHDFVMFYTGFLGEAGYGSKSYFTGHPQLSLPLITELLDRQVSLIGIDAAGIRRGEEHTPTDQICADRGVFVVENLDNLDRLAEFSNKTIEVFIFPINFEGMSGLPCRVVAEV